MKTREIVLLCTAIVFIFILVYLPHLVNPYPTHVDEWRHITEAMKIRNHEYNFSYNSLEFGFHFFLFLISYLVNLVTFYQYLPAIWISLTCLILFFLIYKKTNYNYYVAIFTIIFFVSIKSNVNLLGLWFFTPLTFSLPFIFLFVYFYTEGIEKQNKKYLLISLLFIIVLIFTHAISFLFSLPFLIIYTIYNYNNVKKIWPMLLIFFIIPIIGLLFYSFTNKSNLYKTIFILLNNLQFKYGWGVLELNNSPLELYSLIGFILAIVGIFYIIYIKKEYKKYLAYLLWPITVLFMLIIFRVFKISYLSPYQRNLFYLVIILPLFSAFGLYYLLKNIHYYLNKYIDLKILIKIILIIFSLIIFYLVFMNYLNIPNKTLLYRLIDKEDYNTILFLKQYPKSVVMAPATISDTIYPISGQDFVASVYFYKEQNKPDVIKFYDNMTTCDDRYKLIKKYNVSYVFVQNMTIDCNWSIIYNNSDKLYKV